MSRLIAAGIVSVAVMIAASFVVVGCVGCGGGNPLKAEPHPVHPASLVRAYRDTPDVADRIYTGQRVRVSIGAGEYAMTGSSILWHNGRADQPPAIRFYVERPPRDNSRALEVIGVVRGFSRDGDGRGSGVDFAVIIDADTVTAK